MVRYNIRHLIRAGESKIRRSQNGEEKSGNPQFILVARRLLACLSLSSNFYFRQPLTEINALNYRDHF